MVEKQLVFIYESSIVSLSLGDGSIESRMAALWDDFYVGCILTLEDKRVAWHAWHEVKFEE